MWWRHTEIPTFSMFREDLLCFCVGDNAETKGWTVPVSGSIKRGK